MHLPVLVCCQRRRKASSKVQLSEEILDLIVQEVNSWSSLPYRQYKRANRESLPTLAKLRLTSRTLYRIATPYFYQEFKVKHTLGSRGQRWFLKTPLRSLKRLQQISSSRNAVHIRHVDIEVHDLIRHDEVNPFKEAVADVLPVCLGKLPNLSSTSVFCKPEIVLYTAVASAILRGIFRAFRDNGFPKLREVEIQCPYTLAIETEPLGWEPGPLGITVKDVFSKLRHLSVYTARQAQYFVPFAQNIESLALESQWHMRLDVRSFPVRLRLKVLKLIYVQPHGELLVSLLQGSGELLESVRFQEVQLRSGSWQEVFRTMKDVTSSNLTHFRLWRCCYAELGYGPGNFNLEQGLAQGIYTPHNEDVDALVEVKEKVRSNRTLAGIPLFQIPGGYRFPFP